MDITEQDVLKVRMEAAQLERQAAATRLDTARREAESAQRTLKMADAVAQSMFARQGRPQ